MRKWVEGKSTRQYPKSTESVFKSRIKKDIEQTLMDLTLLANWDKFSETDLNDLFNYKTMMPFFKALFDMKNRDEKEFIERRKRILKIWNQIILSFGEITYVLTMAKNEQKVMLHEKPLRGLEMLFAMSMME